MPVGLPLETDPVVSLIGIPVLQQPHQVLQKIPDKERQHQQFQLLPQVDAFVVHKYRIVLQLPAFHEYKRPEHYPIEPLCQHVFIYYHEHDDKVRNAKFVI